jgi:hypothetical protein
MIDVKPSILTALLANTALITLIGTGPRITQTIADSSNPFPRITFFELGNVDSLYVDDAAYSSEIDIQVDIWNKIVDAATFKSPSTIAIQVDITMKSLGFKRMSSIDLYESDTFIWHKALRYSTNKTIGSD